MPPPKAVNNNAVKTVLPADEGKLTPENLQRIVAAKKIKSANPLAEITREQIDHLVDAVLASPFASAEQKMYAKIDKESLKRQEAINTYFNDIENTMVGVVKKGVTPEQKDAIEKEYQSKIDAAENQNDKKTLELERDQKIYEFTPVYTDKEKDDLLQKAREKYNESREETINAQMAEYMKNEWAPNKTAELKKTVLPESQMQIVERFADLAHKQRQKLESQYDAKFTDSDEYKQYEEEEAKQQIEQRTRGDIEGEAIKKQRAVRLAQEQMQTDFRKAAVGAAMQSPVRSDLEESYRMVSDELIKTGEAKRLGGDSELGKIVNESLKPALELLDKQYQSLERVMKSGDVKVQVMNPQPPRWQ